MYISRVKLDAALRSTRSALANPQQMHAMVAQCFDASPERRGSGRDSERQRPLWRIDTLKGSTYLLVVSAMAPDFTLLLPQLSSAMHSEALVKDYDAFLARLAAGKTMRFRLCANPVHSVMQAGSPEARGKIFGHVTVQQQKNWLEQRSLKYGFELLSFDVVSRGERRFKRQKATVTLTVANYEGLLAIRNADLLKAALVEGIGRAKAYGCGLLTLAPV
jgi:CRISPR system Cascade subunit CasE